jgi:hypothetical protein
MRKNRTRGKKRRVHKKSCKCNKRKCKKSCKCNKRKCKKSCKCNKRKCKKSRRRRQRGGGFLTPISYSTFRPEIATPPNGGVHVPYNGITHNTIRGADQKFYYAKNNRVFGNPLSTNIGMTGGKRRTKKGKRRIKKGRKRSISHKGGGLSNVMNSFPGGTDLRDFYYKAGNVVGSAWSQYNGYGPLNEPSMTNYTSGQPIARNNYGGGDYSIPMDKYIEAGSEQASKKPYTTNY